MTDIERLVMAGLDQGGRLLFDPGAATGQFTKELVHEMRRCFGISIPSDRMAKLLVPWGTKYVFFRYSGMKKDLETVCLTEGDHRFCGATIKGLPFMAEAFYFLHGGILPKGKRLVIGVADDECRVVFGCF